MKKSLGLEIQTEIVKYESVLLGQQSFSFKNENI